jgi:hypothetical protein
LIYLAVVKIVERKRNGSNSSCAIAGNQMHNRLKTTRGGTMVSKPEVSIIESLGFDDERNNLFEGRIISDILARSGKRCIYYYI